MATRVQVVIDCHDPAALARFWAEALGYQLQAPPEGFDSWEAWLKERGVPESEWNAASAIVDPEGIGPRIYFQRVPENKIVKNRVHLDLNVSGGHAVPADERRRRINMEAERLATLGAQRVRPFDIRGEYWVTMLDPEGNEFDLQ